MTREEKLYSMTMKMLVAEAEKLGININKKGKKEDAVQRILTAEMIEEAEKEEETMNATIDLNDDAQTQYLDLEAEKATYTPAEEVTEEPAPKKERKVRTKKTFESLLANVPVLSRVSIQTNGKKRNAVHIQTENGKRRIFGYDGAIIVVTNEKYLHGVAEITAEKKNYGWRIEPTAENMIAIQENYLATLA